MEMTRGEDLAPAINDGGLDSLAGNMEGCLLGSCPFHTALAFRSWPPPWSGMHTFYSLREAGADFGKRLEQRTCLALIRIRIIKALGWPLGNQQHMLAFSSGY